MKLHEIAILKFTNDDVFNEIDRIVNDDDASQDDIMRIGGLTKTPNGFELDVESLRSEMGVTYDVTLHHDSAVINRVSGPNDSRMSETLKFKSTPEDTAFNILSVISHDVEEADEQYENDEDFEDFEDEDD